MIHQWERGDCRIRWREALGLGEEQPVVARVKAVPAYLQETTTR